MGSGYMSHCWTLFVSITTSLSSKNVQQTRLEKSVCLVGTESAAHRTGSMGSKRESGSGVVASVSL